MKMMKVCVILHNMIIEEECMTICMYSPNDILNLPAVIQVGDLAYFTRLLEIQNSDAHHNLRHDLTEKFEGKNYNDDEKDEDADNENDAGDDEDA
uniref:Uncharacterized protein n=1 Tax=Lactuca sativa TaxID=4236 RepID=A0A9R1VGD0_LACSA|nr:hypothetical protein LSAT_V11C500264540 [Lactuca sativa]